ncbi:MAG: serine hydrolase domain-containing protein [Pseudomonadota bacterium]
MRLLALLLILISTGAAAQDSARLEKVENAWRDWLGSHRVGASALALASGGEVTLEALRGTDMNTPAPLASLSKAITGSCVRALVAEGAFSFGDPLADHLPGAVPGLTIAELLTHTGGVWPDTTQEKMWDWVNDAEDRHSDVTRVALPRALEPMGYRYNNENYAILGALVEAVTGESYQEACAERVLAPLGLESPRRSPRYGPFLTWGGWEMSAAEYALFADATFAGSDPNLAPNAPAGGGAKYGLGALYFEAEGLRITWHTGLLCFGSIDGAGAYFVQVDPGFTVAVTFEGCPGEGALADLDQALLTAMLR